MNLKKGSFISHYKIISLLGAGGMGEVWLAEDTILNRKVAIKFLNKKFGNDSDKLQRFIQEAKAVAALNHPNILTIYEIGEAKGKQFIVTEFIAGKTLRDELSERERIPVNMALKIGIQIGEALAAAHQVGIVHRDIKPENIMIRAEGYAKLLDFGLAKLTESREHEKILTEGVTLASVKTIPGMIMGSFLYMSPEQTRGQNVDTRTDIFSLGVVLYEILSSRKPFYGETAGQIMIAILEQEPPPLSTEKNLVPEEFERIIRRALQKNVKDRYPKMREFVRDLRELKENLLFKSKLAQNTETLSLQTEAFTETVVSENAIAVLPFVNLSRDENGDYFSDGLAEELLTVLSKIEGLRVAARTSAFSFKGKSTTVKEIGKALNVSSVLEGSVRTAGNRVRISVQLINVADGYQIWADTYDRTMDDIFAVQDDIAQSVVEESRARLLGEKVISGISRQAAADVAEAAKGRADDPEAQRLMLLGRYFLDRTTRADTLKSIDYFRQALNLDPEYARGWAELGRAYSIEAGRGWVDVEQGFKLSREATERALLLEPELAEGYAQLGRIQLAHDWDFQGAEKSFQRAIELAPGSASVLDGASILEYKLGRFEKAIELSRRVLVQDPLSAAFWHNLGLTYHSAELLKESENAFKKSLEIVSQRFVTSALLALVLMEQGKIAESLAQAEAEPDEFWRIWAQTIIFYLSGEREKSDDLLQEILTQFVAGNEYQIAEIYAMRGGKKESFYWLEQALAKRDAGMTHAKVNPRFKNLHTEKEWEKLLEKIGF